MDYRVKFFCTVICLFLSSSAEIFGQDTEHWFVSRLAMQNAARMHYHQYYLKKGRALGPDVIYVDFGKSNYREVFLGGGLVLFNTRHFGIVHEDYIGRVFGSAGSGALYILPWTKFDYRISSKISGNAVYVFYIPLNDAAKYHQSIERAKLEYDFGRFKLGVGYAGTMPAGKSWQNKPFLTATVKCGPLGEIEFWLQRLPGNDFQVQFRHVLAQK